MTIQNIKHNSSDSSSSQKRKEAFARSSLDEKTSQVAHASSFASPSQGTGLKRKCNSNLGKLKVGSSETSQNPDKKGRIANAQSREGQENRGSGRTQAVKRRGPTSVTVVPNSIRFLNLEKMCAQKQADWIQALNQGPLIVTPVNSTGVNSSFFVRKEDSDSTIALFKPQSGARGMREGEIQSKWGVHPATQWMREVVAFNPHRPDRVPPTCEIRLSIEGKEEVGSLQKFLPEYVSLKDIKEQTHPITVAQLVEMLKGKNPETVQRMWLMDVLNADPDRHAGNIMLKIVEDGEEKKRVKFRSIDHGCDNPDEFQSAGLFYWLAFDKNLAALKMGITPSNLWFIETCARDFPEKKGKILERFSDFPQDALDTNQLSIDTVLIGARLGLNLFQMTLFFVSMEGQLGESYTSPIRMAYQIASNQLVPSSKKGAEAVKGPVNRDLFKEIIAFSAQLIKINKELDKEEIIKELIKQLCQRYDLMDQIDFALD